MICPRCNGSGFVIVQSGGIEGAKPCECRRQAIATLQRERNPPGTPLTLEGALAVVTALCEALQFSPAPGPGRSLIAVKVRDMCSTEEVAQWMAKRTLDLYTKWPALRGLRQILCSLYAPKDGIVVTWSEAYPGGIPPEKPRPDPMPILLPTGHVTSADKTLDGMVIEASTIMSLERIPELQPAEQKAAHAFEAVLKDVVTRPLDREPSPPAKPVKLSAVVPLSNDEEHEPRPVGTYRKITAADLDRANAEKRDRSAELIDKARASLADPKSTWDQREIASEILRGFGVDEAEAP